ncbi:hypothetical protein [Embleya sp. NPDC005971]|uniref:hypothetical protein n=1 Tax=Embleya sp. NPDC005971 TaxID=3156724 RepID=UPI0033EAECBE
MTTPTPVTTSRTEDIRRGIATIETAISAHRDAVNENVHRRETTAWELRYAVAQILPEIRALLAEVDEGIEPRHLRAA